MVDSNCPADPPPGLSQARYHDLLRQTVGRPSVELFSLSWTELLVSFLLELPLGKTMKEMGVAKKAIICSKLKLSTMVLSSRYSAGLHAVQPGNSHCFAAASCCNLECVRHGAYLWSAAAVRCCSPALQGSCGLQWS